ncbi:hypothetical protein G6F48_007138 [Rhizopus delemar]|nr:hypothetical protein G6F36_010889 [Rhizopus arrhizus]KAG1585631.1 hypothetical protein G6F48_007138 [Rhizopus delemar]
MEELYQTYSYFPQTMEYPLSNESFDSSYSPTLEIKQFQPDLSSQALDSFSHDDTHSVTSVHPKVTINVWEDENTLYYQVEAKGIYVTRRQDNDMINGTKLMNVVGLSRGRRDGILKNEKGRIVVKIGAMHLKGVWIPFERARDLATKFSIIDLLYPLFADDPSIFDRVNLKKSTVQHLSKNNSWTRFLLSQEQSLNGNITDISHLSSHLYLSNNKETDSATSSTSYSSQSPTVMYQQKIRKLSSNNKFSTKSKKNEEQKLTIKEYVPTNNISNVSNDNITDTKPYNCPVCNQSFSRPHNLKSHLTTHSEERPFQCEVCNHHFRRQHDLRRHQKLHTGERPYVCTNCSRTFARLDALNRHCKTENGSACALVMLQQTKHKTAYKTKSLKGSRPIFPQPAVPHLYLKPEKSTPSLLPSPDIILSNSHLAPPSLYTSQTTVLPISPSSPPSFHSPRPILPPLSHSSNETVDKLQREIEELKKDYDYLKLRSQKEINNLKSKIHDIEVEVSFNLY